LIKALEKLDLKIIDKGGRHIKALCPNTKKKTHIPRHNDIKSGVIKSICDFLIEQGYAKEEIKKALEIK